MQDDISALKKGQAPAGFKLEKESEKDIKPVLEATSPKITPPPSPISHVELGRLEKSKPMAGSVIPPLATPKAPSAAAPSLGLAKSTISIPSVGGLKFDLKKIVIYVIIGIVAVVAIVLLLPRLTSTPLTTPTPNVTLSSSPTATPLSIENFFSTADTVAISLGADFQKRFINIAYPTATTTSEPAIFKITSADKTRIFGFKEFTDGALVTVPNEVNSFVDDNSLFVTSMLKSDKKMSFGFIVKLPDPNMISSLDIALQNWESQMPQALADLLKIDQTKAASTVFSGNTYNGTAIRYINFPDANSTIDYAIIQARNGESYLAIVNSKEHIYAIINKLNITLP